MKKILLYIGVAIAAIGCTKDVDVDSVGTPLTITSNIATRAEKTGWENGDAIGVNVTTTTPVTNEKFTTTGNGVFTSETKIYLPTSDAVTLFAYYPYVDDAAKITAYPIDLIADPIDLLSVKKTGVTASTADVDLTFEHKLSKISLEIEAGNELTPADLEDLKVIISGTKTTATFDLEGNTVADQNTPADITLTTAADGLTSSAIIIPQSLEDVTLDFATKSCGTFSASLTNTTFAVGTEYTYKVTINVDGIVITAGATINGWAGSSEESGTAEIVDIECKSGTYYINSAKGLAAFRDVVNGTLNTAATYTYHGFTFTGTADTDANAILTRDIDFSDYTDGWGQIGYWTNTEGDQYYAGTFDGGGHKISGLNISTDGNKKGLFRGLTSTGVIRDLGVSGSATNTTDDGTDSYSFSGFVAWNEGLIINCYSDVTVVAEKITNVGGIAGYNKGYIVNCYNQGAVTGEVNVGGIVGYNYDAGYVGYCYSVGAITGKGSDVKVGGIAGWNYTEGVVSEPTIKGSFCSKDTTYSIGQTDYLDSDGTTANVCDDDYLKSESFATTMTNGAYTYNNDLADKHSVNIAARGWIYNSNDYPTLDFITEAAVEQVIDISYNSLGYNIYSAKGLAAFAALVNGTSKPTFTDGDTLKTSGDDDSYFQFGSVGSDIDGKLMNNIDLSSVCGETLNGGTDWTPIGTSSKNYAGTFNGNGCVVSGLYIDDVDAMYHGLFDCINGAEISKLGVSGKVAGGIYVGGIVGYAVSSTITSSYNSADVTAEKIGNAHVGGVVGHAISTEITSCYNSGTIAAKYESIAYVGGIVGDAMSSATIKSCYSYGSVSAAKSGSYIGGVVGNSSGSSTISYCYYDSSVDSNSVGGAVNGTNYADTTDSYITYTYGIDCSTYMETLLNNLLSVTTDTWSVDNTITINNDYPILTWQVTAD